MIKSANQIHFRYAYLYQNGSQMQGYYAATKDSALQSQSPAQEIEIWALSIHLEIIIFYSKLQIHSPPPPVTLTYARLGQIGNKVAPQVQYNSGICPSGFEPQSGVRQEETGGGGGYKKFHFDQNILYQDITKHSTENLFGCKNDLCLNFSIENYLIHVWKVLSHSQL